MDVLPVPVLHGLVSSRYLRYNFFCMYGVLTKFICKFFSQMGATFHRWSTNEVSNEVHGAGVV